MKLTNVESLLKDLNSIELKELRKQFNSEINRFQYEIQKAERIEIENFINSLNIAGKWSGHGNVVSINQYAVDLATRNRLDDISERISKAFKDLVELKREIAVKAMREGTPLSRYFKTTVKRMNSFKDGNYHR